MFNRASKSIHRFLFVIALACLCYGASYAAPTYYQFRATVDGLDNPNGVLDQSIQLGSEVNGLFVFDPAQSVTTSIALDYSHLYDLSAPNGMTIAIGDYVYRSQDDVGLHIAKYPFSDAFTLDFINPYWLSPDRVLLDFWGPPGACFPSTDINDNFPGAFSCYTQQSYVGLWMTDFYFNAHITSMIPVTLDNPNQCRDGKWRLWRFMNQGDCIQFVNTGR